MKKHLLIVDDDMYLIDLYASRFVSLGCDVERAHSGKEALEKIKKRIPDLVLMDISMPDMDGLETLEHIRADEHIRAVRVVILTNKGEPEDITKSTTLGAIGYIIKANVTPAELVSEVTHFL